MEEGFGLPIVEAWARFRRPSRYGDLLRVETRLQEIRAKALIFRFEFYPETGDELLAEGTANLVAIDRAFRPQDLPPGSAPPWQGNSILTSPEPETRIGGSNFKEGDQTLNCFQDKREVDFIISDLSENSRSTAAKG